MTIFDMIGIWVEWSNVDDTARKIDYQSHSAGFKSSNDTYGNVVDDWEVELHKKIAINMEALIYGDGKERGILTLGEQLAIQHNHIAAGAWTSNRKNIGNIDDDYATATIKLTSAMLRRGFYFS